jgi:hypothetical protein
MATSMHYDEILARRALPCTLRFVSAQGGDEVVLPGLLAEVGARREQAGFEQFSMLFRVTSAGGPRQGTYAVTFADATSWEMFLVPVQREGADIVYEACFNRSVPATAT